MDRGARVLVSIHTRTRTNAAIHSPTTRTTREGCPAARSTSAAAAPSGTIVDVVGAETRHRMDCGLMHFPQQFTGCTTRGRSRASGGPARLGGKCSTSPVRACGGVLGLCWRKCDFVFVLCLVLICASISPHMARARGKAGRDDGRDRPHRLRGLHGAVRGFGGWMN